MIIDIVSDVVCPWCYVGKRQLERALTLEPQPGLQVAWRPFQLNPDMPEEGMERAAYLRAKFGEDGGGDRYARVRAAGASVGLDFAFDRIRRTPNTLQAHRLIRWSAAIDAQDAMVEALFRAYFLEGEDVGDKATLARIAVSVGFAEADTAAYLAGDRDAEALRAEDAFARQVGITGVPCFIVDRKFAISGAQPPEAFLEIFEAARREADAPETDAV
ncbi:MAG: DsbA family oxidoreductase [Alphaproteobacteria bacterium]|nr:DsbA family oxidoreductase [Alphaproteobacteria bacterium]